MKQFNIKRFGQLLKWWAMTNQGSLIKLAGGAVIITFLVEVLLMIDVLTVKDAALALSLEQRQVENISGLMTFVFALCVTFSGSYMSSGLNKKQHREAFLMVPATQLEKYMLRWLYVVILIPVGIFLSFCLADVLRMLIMFAIGPHEFVSVLSGFSKSYVINIEDGQWLWSLSFLFVSALLFTQSFYILGGVLFRRHQFILTSVAGILLSVVIIYCISYFANNNFKLISGTNGVVAVHPLTYVVIAVNIVLALVNYGLSYYFFKRMQIINNKWLNI